MTYSELPTNGQESLYDVELNALTGTATKQEIGECPLPRRFSASYCWAAGLTYLSNQRSISQIMCSMDSRPW